MKNIGVQHVMTALTELAPSPDAQGAVAGRDDSGNEVSRQVSADEPASAYIFKTIADPFAGRIQPAPRHERRPEIGRDLPEHAQERP